MSEDAETVHVAFGDSFAVTLREALSSLGSAEHVIGLPDSLSVGPIDPPDAKLRQAWSKSVLRNAIDVDPIVAERAWAAATAPDIDPVFWVCSRCPMEHACFLAFAERLDGRSFDIVDATNLDLAASDGNKRLRSLGMMRIEDILAARLYETRRRITAEELRAASATWQKLRRENAPFRIVRDGRLVSAPLTHYDALLIEQASEEWEVTPRLIGRVFVKLLSGNDLDGEVTGDLVLFGRTLSLGESGLLEIAGSGPSMRDYQVRRPVK